MSFIPALPTTLQTSINTTQQIIFDRDAYAASVAPDPIAQLTINIVGQLTGDLAYNLAETNAVDGCVVIASFNADGSTRTITWGANIAPITATLALAANEGATVVFVFDATLGKWTASV